MEHFETLVLSGFNKIKDLDTTEQPRLQSAVSAMSKLAMVVKTGRDQSLIDNLEDPDTPINRLNAIQSSTDYLMQTETEGDQLPEESLTEVL